MAKKRAKKPLIETDEEFETPSDDAPEESSKVPSLRRQVFRPSWLFLLALVATAVLLGPSLIQRLPDLAERQEYRLQVENIHVQQMPHWVPHDLVQQVAELERWQRQPLSLLDASCSEQIAKAFARHPWVGRVNRVRLKAGAEVELSLTFRKPVAMVEAGSGKYYPIDADAVLLPPADFTRADVKRYPIIVNPSTMPEGPAGTYWGDLMVLGAARLADHLLHASTESESHWEHLNLAGILLPERTTAEVKIEDIHYQLLTRNGSRILWGRAPGTDNPGELTAEQKIGRLTQYLADFGTFRSPQGPLEIDIRHWREITQRRLSSRETSIRR